MDVAIINHNANGKHESIQPFSELGMFWTIFKMKINYTWLSFLQFAWELGDDAKELINAAIEARKFSYRYMV